MSRTAFAVSLALVCFAVSSTAQVVVGNQQRAVGGVYIDTDGTVKARATDTTADLAAQKLRAKTLNAPAKTGAMTYVSLPRLFAQVEALAKEGKEIPEDLRYLSGLTSIRYVFVFPEEKDLVIAGPSEPFDAANKGQPFGKISGRPVLHLDDLVVALRTHLRSDRLMPFGCSIDPHPDSLNRSTQVMQEYATATRAARMKAMKDAIGPQQVRLFGAPQNTRYGFVTLAADYKLKRLCLAMDAMPVAGIGAAMDNSRAAGNRFWFEADYKPLLVSPDGTAYEFRGQRLQLKCGALLFDDKGATENAKGFAKRFTDKIPQLATVVPVFADLQNIADLALLASLIRHDGLAKKAGMDLSFVLSDQLKVASVPTPTSAETLVNFTSGSIVAGGVTLDLSPLLASDKRESDKGSDLGKSRTRPAGDWKQTRGE